MGIDKPGVLYAGSLPTGTARPTFSHADPTTDHTPHALTVANYDWYYMHNRMWAVGDSSNRGSNVFYFAPGYDTDLYTHGYSKLICDDDTAVVLGLIPFGNQVMAIKAADSYVLYQANQWGGRFLRSRITQGFGANAMTDVTEKDGVVYASNANGVFGFDGQRIVEFTAPIRDNLGNFTGADLNGDNSSGIEYTKNRLVADDGTKQYVVDLNNGNLYDYSTTGFRWTSRTIERADEDRLVVDRIALILSHANAAEKTLKFQVMDDTGTWKGVEQHQLKKRLYEYERVEIMPKWIKQQEKWAMRITALSANLHIHEVQLYITQGEVLKNEREAHTR
jgi:hypothetical protein